MTDRFGGLFLSNDFIEFENLIRVNHKNRTFFSNDFHYDKAD